MENNEDVRLDKYLWAIRIFKTRTLATEAIDGGKVKMNGVNVKPSKKLKIGDQYSIKKEGESMKIEVVQIIEKRTSAPIAKTCYTILESSISNEKKLSSVFFNSSISREKGIGRPTKKDRRDIDDFL